MRLFGHTPAYPGGLEIVDPDEDEEEDEEIEDSPRTVLITGACGNIGRKLRDAWAGTYDLVLLDVEGGASDPDVIVADLGRVRRGMGRALPAASTRSSTWRPTPTSSRRGRRWSGPTSTPSATSSTPRRWPGSSG